MAETQNLDGVPEEMLSDYARAKLDPSLEAFDNLSKTESIYIVCDLLEFDTPEGHPSDHNGNVTTTQVNEWRDRVFTLIQALGEEEAQEALESYEEEAEEVEEEPEEGDE